VNMPLRSAWIIKEAFSFLVKSQMLVLGLVWSAGLSGFPIYLIDQKNFAVM
jgi:hypothetical protein